MTARSNVPIKKFERTGTPPRQSIPRYGNINILKLKPGFTSPLTNFLTMALTPLSDRSWNEKTGINPKGMTREEALKEAGLNWKVFKNAHHTTDAHGNTFEVPGTSIAMRDDLTGPASVLAVHGKYRRSWENSDTLNAFYDFCDATGLVVDRVACLKGGKTSYYSAILPIKLAPHKAVGDITEVRLIFRDSHVQDKGAAAILGYNRLWCSNGCFDTIRGKEKVINHSKAFDPKRIEALLRAACDAVMLEQFKINMLTDVEISPEQAQKILRETLGKRENNKASGQILPWEQQSQTVKLAFDIFDVDNDATVQGTRLEGKEIKYTGFALYEAVKEALCHGRQVKAEGEGTGFDGQFDSRLAGATYKDMQKLSNSLGRAYIPNWEEIAKTPSHLRKVAAAQPVHVGVSF